MDTDGRTEEDEVITVTEAAKEAGVTQAAIRNAIYSGKLKARQLYGRQLITRSALSDYLETKRNPGRPPKEQKEH